MKRNRVTMLFGVAALALTATFSGAKAFPDRDMEVVVNYGAGGGTDLSTRILCDAAEGILGRSIRVVNRAGGSGTVGPTFVSMADPDGYTIGVASFSPMAVVPHLQDVPYQLDSFDFILGFARYRFGIAVAAESPFTTIDDLVAAAKGGERLTYASTGAMAAVTMARLGDASDTEYKWVRYNSGQEAATAALGGVVDVLVENPTNIAPHVENGTMRLLASASSVRWFELPDVPTLKELGYDVVVESYAGLAAPTGIPEDARATLERAFADALSDQNVQTRLLDLGMEPIFFTGEEYRQILIDGYEDMGRDLVAIGLKSS